MTDKHHKKQDNKNTIGSVAVKVAEAVVIAGVAVAATIALKDEKTRKKVKKALVNVKDQAIGYVEDMQNKAQDKKGKVEKKLVKGKEQIKKAENSAKDTKKVVEKSI